jgi:hypothetical protein
MPFNLHARMHACISAHISPLLNCGLCMHLLPLPPTLCIPHLPHAFHRDIDYPTCLFVHQPHTTGQEVTVVAVGEEYTSWEGFKDEATGETKIGLSYAKLCKFVKPGNTILMSDGTITIKVRIQSIWGYIALLPTFYFLLFLWATNALCLLPVVRS